METRHKFLQINDSCGRKIFVLKILMCGSIATTPPWASQKEEQQGQLYFPLRAAGEVSGAGDLILSLFHHPYGWLNASNSLEFEDLIDRTSDIVLTGHEHVEKYSQKRNITGEETNYSKGSVLQESGSNKSGFNVILIDTAEQKQKYLPGMAQGKIIGLHQGRMEFGPRALGCRSIIGDARSPQMQSVMNLKIKFRESFRPFAPSVLREHVAEWFELDRDSPYMLLVADVALEKRIDVSEGDAKPEGFEKLKVKRSQIPAVTHVDCSARIQTVTRDSNPLYWEIIEAFRKRTGCPVIVNTSFNVRGEPIVCTPADSYRCFMRTEIDCLVLESFVLTKEGQEVND